MAFGLVSGFPTSWPPTSGANQTGEVVWDKDVSPWTNLVAGDWIAIAVYVRANTAPTVLDAGGQTWRTETDVNQGTTAHMRLFHCRFNGTWTADPTFGDTLGSAAPHSARAWAWRDAAQTNIDGFAENGLDQQDGGASFTAPTTPFDVVRAGQTPTVPGCMVIAVFASSDDNTWVVQTGGWTDEGTFTNIGGSDCSISSARKTIPDTSASGSVTNRQTVNGGDAGIALVWTVRPVPTSLLLPPDRRQRSILSM